MGDQPSGDRDQYRRSRPFRRGRLADQSGAALVEMAFVLPILLVLILGIVDFSLYFYNDLQLSHAARDAARTASVARSAADYANASAIVQSAVLLFPSNTTNTSPLVTPPTATNRNVTAVGSGTYRFISPFIPITVDLKATAVMRHE